LLFFFFHFIYCIMFYQLLLHFFSVLYVKTIIFLLKYLFYSSIVCSFPQFWSSINEVCSRSCFFHGIFYILTCFICYYFLQFHFLYSFFIHYYHILLVFYMLEQQFFYMFFQLFHCMFFSILDFFPKIEVLSLYIYIT